MTRKIDSVENINEIEHPTVPRAENRKRKQWVGKDETHVTT